ncbi:hypothetical protein LJB98_05860 [Bacteroidales bacterium OttesenSCG-928-M11]|nr:hypothetical protein [Bacteroidales bacterium OttesenSCG-928-M11]
MKKHIWIPIALLIYLGVIAFFTFPDREPSSGLSYTQYYTSIAFNIILIAAVSYFIKKREENKRKRK